MSMIHSALLEAYRVVKKENTSNSLNVKGFSVISGQDCISISPGHRDAGKTKADFKKVTVTINGLQNNVDYDDNNPGISPVVHYFFKSEMLLIDFARQLLGYAKKQTSTDLVNKVKEINRISQEPVFADLIIDPSVILTWLTFFDFLSEKNHPCHFLLVKSGSNTSDIKLASTSKVVRKAASAKSVSKSSMKPVSLFGRYQASFLKNQISISTVNKSDFRVEITQCIRQSGDQYCNFKFMQKIDGRFKQLGRQEVFNREDLVSMCFHYLSREADPIADLDVFQEINCTPDRFKSKMVDFVRDENENEINVPLHLVAALFAFARDLWKKEKLQGALVA